jgi:hypothetical protein
MRGEQFFRQAQAALKARQLGFRSISHTSQLRFYGEDNGHHWKQGRIATAHQVESEAPVVRVRAIDTEPQAVRHTQDLVVTQKQIETRRVIIKPLTLLQKRRFLERRRVTRVASLWLDDIYRGTSKRDKTMEDRCRSQYFSILRSSHSNEIRRRNSFRAAAVSFRPTRS